jgi:tRNA pseudouridine55 synthase
MKGFINVLKAPGITSSTVVGLVRQIIGIKKVGHAGTLDPAACGVLPIMIGKAAKLFDYLADDGKEYIAEFVFGIDTDTLDMQGQIVNTCDIKVTADEIAKTLPKFHGKLKQYPPRVSAISINGKKAYNLHRQGIDFEVPQREVIIDNIELIRQTGENSFLFKINCSKGTYIRSLCKDIAATLGTYGYVSYLNRTKSGFFKIDDAISIEDLRIIEIDKAIIHIEEPIQHIKKVVIEDKYFFQLINGIKINYSFDLDNINRVYCNNKFIGLGKKEVYNDIKYIKIFKRFFEEEDV